MIVETSSSVDVSTGNPSGGGDIARVLNNINQPIRRTVIRTSRNGEVTRRTMENNGRPDPMFSSNIRQILLHEERRTEQRPVNQNARDENVPTSLLSTNDAPNGMKNYIIVDQIIFEMDYSSGCWKKLRRKIRMADKSHLNQNSTSASSSAANMRPESDTLNIDPSVSVNRRASSSATNQTPVSTANAPAPGSLSNPVAALDNMAANNRAATFLRNRNGAVNMMNMRAAGLRRPQDENGNQPQPSTAINDQPSSNRVPRYAFNNNGPVNVVRGTMLGSARTRQISSSSSSMVNEDVPDLLPISSSASMAMSGR